MRRATLVSIAALAAIVGCRRDRGREIGPAPERSAFRSAPSSSASSAPLVDGLVGYAGEEVAIDGELVVPKHEHIEEAMPGKSAMCLSLASRGEVVVYFGETPRCARMRVTGRAFVIRGLTPKTHAAYAEVALDVSSWACL